jgi:hypothetical protein
MAKLIAVMIGVKDDVNSADLAQNLFEAVFDKHPKAQEWLQDNLDANICVEYQYAQDDATQNAGAKGQACPRN